MAYSLVRPAATDYNCLEKISEIDCQAFGVDGISVFNLAQFARSGSVFALQDDGKVVAEAVVLRNLDDTGANIFGFAVDESITSRGYGSVLMNFLLEFARRAGISYFELTMNPEDARATSFYMKKFGFFKKADLAMHPKKPQKRWLMRLDL
ncbi:MAG: GNAT family N-acetyltransferase [Candidatus Rifleibacteriota bacterium]